MKKDKTLLYHVHSYNTNKGPDLKHIRHVLYLQFTMNVFQIYFLNAVNELIFYYDL